MFKHANTFAPGDRVQLVKNGEKVAGIAARGKIAGQGLNSENLRVVFDDGSVGYPKLEELVAEPS